MLNKNPGNGVIMEEQRPKLRHELKFYINHYQYIEFQRRLQVIMRRDAFTTDEGGYHVRSLYFDDIYNTALFEKNAGVFRHATQRPQKTKKATILF
jgi:hypothetical protein